MRARAWDLLGWRDGLVRGWALVRACVHGENQYVSHLNAIMRARAPVSVRDLLGWVGGMD